MCVCVRACCCLGVCEICARLLLVAWLLEVMFDRLAGCLLAKLVDCLARVSVRPTAGMRQQNHE